MMTTNLVKQLIQEHRMPPQLWLRKTEAQALEDILNLCAQLHQPQAADAITMVPSFSTVASK